MLYGGGPWGLVHGGAGATSASSPAVTATATRAASFAILATPAANHHVPALWDAARDLD